VGVVVEDLDSAPMILLRIFAKNRLLPA
jgi:hypothetical protein